MSDSAGERAKKSKRQKPLDTISAVRDLHQIREELARKEERRKKRKEEALALEAAKRRREEKKAAALAALRRERDEPNTSMSFVLRAACSAPYGIEGQVPRCLLPLSDDPDDYGLGDFQLLLNFQKFDAEQLGKWMDASGIEDVEENEFRERCLKLMKKQAKTYPGLALNFERSIWLEEWEESIDESDEEDVEESEYNWPTLEEVAESLTNNIGRNKRIDLIQIMEEILKDEYYSICDYQSNWRAGNDAQFEWLCRPERENGNGGDFAFTTKSWIVQVTYVYS